MDEQKKAPPTPQHWWMKFNIFYLLIAIWFVVMARDFIQFQRRTEAIPYSQFLDYIDQKKVSEVSIGNESIQGTLKDTPAGHPNRFTSLKIDDPQLADHLRKADVKFGAVQESTLWKDVISWLLPVFIMLGFWWFILSKMKNSQQTQFLSLGKSKAKIFAEKDLKIRFTDVAGVEEVKDELQEIVHFLKDPAHYSRLGGRMPKGILMVGPPGTGKTLLARAVAGEANVPFFSINGSEFVEMFVGLGAARVRDLFVQARTQSPCIIFIDELDALGKARGFNAMTGGSNDEKEQTLNQLLAELDGFDASQGIILLGATNRPEVLDPALLRAGRFDRQIVVGNPDRKAREQILALHIKKVKTAPHINIEELALITAGFSGADLANIANEAALIATRRNAEQVEQQDFAEAVERTMAGLTRKDRILSADERKRVAYHEMGHATVGFQFGDSEVVHKVTIIPRGMAALGYTFRRPTEERYLMSRQELENKMAVLLGGRAAEVLFFQDISTGAADDLDKATEIARAMVTRFGMNESLGLATFEKDSAQFLGNQGGSMRRFDYSDSTAQAIDLEIKRLLESALHRARTCLEQNRSFVDETAMKLLKEETLLEIQLRDIWQKYHPEEKNKNAKPRTSLSTELNLL